MVIVFFCCNLSNNFPGDHKILQKKKKSQNYQQAFDKNVRSVRNYFWKIIICVVGLKLTNIQTTDQCTCVTVVFLSFMVCLYTIVHISVLLICIKSLKSYRDEQ